MKDTPLCSVVRGQAGEIKMGENTILRMLEAFKWE